MERGGWRGSSDTFLIGGLERRTVLIRPNVQVTKTVQTR